MIDVKLLLYLHSKIEETERRKNEVSKRNRQKLEEANNSIRDLQNSFDNMDAMNAKVRQCNPKDQERKLKVCCSNNLFLYR